jgi:hypothetical protein
MSSERYLMPILASFRRLWELSKRNTAATAAVFDLLKILNQLD